MIEKDTIPTDDNKRIEEILKLSWRILKTRFIERRYEISSEAPFQHYFAHIISTIGDTYCITRTEKFMVDLEVKLEVKNNNDKGKKNYIDITCGFSRGEEDSQEKTAIELKFKTKGQSAIDDGRIAAFKDLKKLELASKEDSYAQGRFFMITDCQTYINESKKGKVGKVFPTHDEAETQASQTFCYTEKINKQKKEMEFTLDNSYHFKWEKIDKTPINKSDKKEEWYFLEIEVLKPRTN
jgi:hypothetical protein